MEKAGGTHDASSPNHHADKETHMGHVTYLRPQGHRSRAGPRSVQGGGAWAGLGTYPGESPKKGASPVGPGALCAKAVALARSMTQRAVLWVALQRDHGGVQEPPS